MADLSKNLEPCGHRVLVSVGSVDVMSAGGIILNPDTSERDTKATQVAKVIKIGRGAFRDYGDGHSWCEVGDLVRIVKYSGDDLKDEKTGVIYRIINDIDIMGRFQGE